MTLIPTGRWLLAGFLALLSVLPVSAVAQEQLIRKAVAERFPNAKVESITKTPYPGLLEMIVDGTVFYTDEKFTFVIDGSLIETKTWSNITQARRDEIEARLQGPIAFRDLPLAQAVKTVRGNGRRVIATFEDPNCGFCRQFHGQLAKLNDVTIYTFLYPIISPPDSVEKSRAVWCAKDRARAGQLQGTDRRGDEARREVQREVDADDLPVRRYAAARCAAVGAARAGDRQRGEGAAQVVAAMAAAPGQWSR